MIIWIRGCFIPDLHVQCIAVKACVMQGARSMCWTCHSYNSWIQELTQAWHDCTIALDHERMMSAQIFVIHMEKDYTAAEAQRDAC